jgi:AraC family transcriptional regulator
MTFKKHNETRYASSQLIKSAEFSRLHVQHRRLQPGHLDPITFKCNEVDLVISGHTLTQRKANGWTRGSFLRPGIARVSPIGTHEDFAETADPLDILNIYLPSAFIERSALEDYEIDPAKVELSYVVGLNDPLLYHLGLALYSILEQAPEPTDLLFLDAMQSALAAHLVRSYSIDRWKPPTKKMDFDPNRLRRVLDLIEARFAGSVSLRDLAAESRLSEFHFARLFQKEVGISPHRYVVHRRVQEAQRKLTRDYSSLAEIAVETGFGSQANFARVFRKFTGLTPSQYRELHRA